MILTIPTSSEPFYSITVVLEGKAYTFAFKYNQRGEFWSFSLLLEDGTSLTSGTKVVCGPNLLWRCADRRKPPGILLANPTTGATDEPPGLEELGIGKRVQLVYVTSDELV